MADIVYTVNQSIPENITGVEQISQPDSQLINQFEINNLFDRNKNFVELHIFDLADNILQSDYNYTNYKELGNSQSAGREGASILTVDPIEDTNRYGYGNGDVKLLYHFLNDLFTDDKSKVKFFIQDISTDRTELKIQTLDIPNEEINNYVSRIINNIAAQSYFSEFRLNFQNNDLLIGVNINTLVEGGNTTVVVKLYEPLPNIYDIKSTLSVVEIVSDSTAFEVQSNINTPVEVVNSLRPANFNLEDSDNEVIPTQYLNYQELFSYPINNTNSEVYSLLNERGAELSIDHTDYENFIHFSSAYERLANFKYKIQLLENYSASISQINNATSQSIGITGSTNYFNTLTQGILSNFDHYERFLYYESSSNTWPKLNTSKPYINAPTSDPNTVNWYVSQLGLANKYDSTNLNALYNTVPSYLRDDSSNASYITFIYMIGQHFDNLWIYAKGVSDKYDADNRLDFGISKDLIGEVLKNFGIKLYTSNKSIEDLFSSFVGQAYQSGSEVINNYITGSLTGSNTPIQPTSLDNYQKEVQKRIYHNLPLLLKSKGTERGLRALINCYGIPSDILDIKYYGGRNTGENPFYGDFQYYTSSLDKIRLDNTGSMVEGNTLSQYTSIIKRDNKYTDDLHSIEVGFSPTDNVDNYIISKSLSTGSLSDFNIDNYLGDPRNLYLDNYYTISTTGTLYNNLQQLTEQIMSGSTAYNVKDFVRLIKFFDNTIFKMVKDFIPARVAPNTGIVIKPHTLNRSKAKSVQVEVEHQEITGSIDIGTVTGSNGGSFRKDIQEHDTRYIQEVQTPVGIGTITTHLHDEAKFDGEFRNSKLTVSTGELNVLNDVKYPQYVPYYYNIQYWGNADNLCILNTTTPNGNDGKFYITPGTYPITTFFSGVPQNNSEILLDTVPVIFPYAFNTASFTQYQEIELEVSNENLLDCTSSVDIVFGVCEVELTSDFPGVIAPDQTYDITTWFTTGSNPANSIGYFVDEADVTPTANNYIFGSATGVSYTVKVEDINLGGTCFSQGTTATNVCTIVAKNTIGLSVQPQIKIGPVGLVYEFEWPVIPVGPTFNQEGLASFFLGITEPVSYSIFFQPTLDNVVITPGESTTLTDIFNNTFTFDYTEINPNDGQLVCRMTLNQPIEGRGLVQIAAFKQPCFSTITINWNAEGGISTPIEPADPCLLIQEGTRPEYCDYIIIEP